MDGSVFSETLWRKWVYSVATLVAVNKGTKLRLKSLKCMKINTLVRVTLKLHTIKKYDFIKIRFYCLKQNLLFKYPDIALTFNLLGNEFSNEKSAASIITENEKIRWVPNEAYNNWQICQTEFSLFFRKHHWRNCGVLVCDECSSHREYVSGYRDERVRVWKLCFNNFLTLPSEIAA